MPAIAFSLDTHENHLGVLDYGAAARVARQIVQTIASHRIPAGILLNVNIPYLTDEAIKGIQITRQGMRVYRDRLDQRMDPRGRAYFWIGGDAPTGIPEEGTDVGGALGRLRFHHPSTTRSDRLSQHARIEQLELVQ